LYQRQQGLPISGVLEVERDRSPATKHLVLIGRPDLQATCWPFYPHHVGAQIRQQHRCMRRRPNPR
jgi:hypothetical protein